jgi:hypothetical protein
VLQIEAFHYGVFDEMSLEHTDEHVVRILDTETIVFNFLLSASVSASVTARPRVAAIQQRSATGCAGII